MLRFKPDGLLARGRADQNCDFSLHFPPVWAYRKTVSNKAERIARMVGHGSAGGLDPFYEGYFDCFNRGQFYEAHDILEQLWLKDRHGANGAFYKGLIQLAGAFVHLQKDRLGPSAVLFKLAGANLGQYAGTHERLAIPAVLVLVEHWLARLEGAEFQSNPLRSEPAPVLRLE
jgi:hypothetical protein